MRGGHPYSARDAADDFLEFLNARHKESAEINVEEQLHTRIRNDRLSDGAWKG